MFAAMLLAGRVRWIVLAAVVFALVWVNVRG